LTSPKEIKFGRLIGQGSFGSIYKGRWGLVYEGKWTRKKFPSSESKFGLAM